MECRCGPELLSSDLQAHRAALKRENPIRANTKWLSMNGSKTPDEFRGFLTISRRVFHTKGKLVGLAEFLPQDYEPFYQGWQDPATQRNFNSMHDGESYEDFLAMFTHPEKPQRFTAAIVRLQDLATVGHINLAPAHLEPDLGIWIYEPFRFKGYGTEAVRLAVDYIFRELNLDYIIAGIYEFNRSSVNLFTKVGFAREPKPDEAEESVFGEGQIVQLGFRLNRQIWAIFSKVEIYSFPPAAWSRPGWLRGLSSAKDTGHPSDAGCAKIDVG